MILCLFSYQLLVAKDLETVLALSSTVSANSNDRAPLATALLQIFRHEHQEAHLLKTLNDFDIDNEGQSFYMRFFLYYIFFFYILCILFRFCAIVL